jgi:pimeloyl-ACP methyl ester carboxylesterase
LTTAYYRAGEGNEKKLLLIHGNVSSSVFYLPLFPALAERYDVVAPDLRCFGHSDALPVDATRGFRDWTDDLHELVQALGWDRFAMVGWSLGGCIAMQYILEHGEALTGVALINPGSPFGFGGTRDAQGTPLEPVGLGSGGGCVNAKLIQALLSGDRTLPRATLRSVYFKQDFEMGEWEELFVDSILRTRVGEGMYPGDTRKVEQWPFVAAGDRGICNTLTPNHGNVSAIAEAVCKPPILWVRGESDTFVSDCSTGDFGFLGQCGFVPGWPGLESYPPQPMLAQTRYVLDRYAANGGRYTETVLPGSHGCHLESPEAFVAALDELLR